MNRWVRDLTAAQQRRLGVRVGFWRRQGDGWRLLGKDTIAGKAKR